MEKTKILIDGRAFINNGSSISIYLYNLLLGLAGDNSFHYIVVINNKDYIKKFEQISNIGIRYSSVQNNVIWDNIIIPFYALLTSSKIVFYPKGSTSVFRIPGKKILVTIHGMIYKVQPEIHSRIENVYWSTIGKIASIISNSIIAVSRQDKEDLVCEGYSSKKITIIPIGIAKPFLVNYSKEQIDNILTKYGLIEKEYLIQVGHLTKKKNQIFTVELFRKISSDFPKLKLVLIGGENTDQKYSDDLKKVVAKYGLENKVVFTGSVDQNESTDVLPILVKNANVFLFPSTYEGFGMPPVESMGAGTVVMSSDKGALPEVLGEENVLELDSDAWEAQLVRLLKDDKYCDTIISRQSKVADKYKWDTISTQYVEKFKLMLLK